MKTAAVLCLILNLQQCLTIPLSTENSSELTKSLQDDSVPIALLLVVPSGPQFRDDEDITIIEDQIVNLLLRDAVSPFQEEHASEVLKQEQLFAEDLRALNPLLRSGEDIKVSIVEEPFIFEDILPELRKDKDFDKNVLPGPIPSSEDSTLDSVTLEEVRLMLEESLPSTEDGVQNLQDASSLQERPIVEDRPSERSYKNEEYLPKGVQTIATYPEISEGDAIPILLNCAPKVERGHLADSAPSYRSHDSVKDIDIKEKDSKTSDEFKDDGKNSNVLDLNSPSSILSVERRKRHTWPETGATHYKVSEDYPETLKGNHHLVSADYPQPNMVRITTQEH